MLPLDAQIEAILFYRPEPIKITKLGELLSKTPEEISDALDALRQKLSDRGLVIIENDGKVMLGTSPSASELIEKIAKDELSGEIGKAGLETLSLILYRGPIGRSEIDYIRGVNSSHILRHLLVRGLIDRVNKEGEGRGFVYKPSMELLQHLGLSQIEDLPEYGAIEVKVKEFISEKEAETNTEKHAS